AKAAIPDGIGENEQWTTHAQVLFAECMRVMHKRGESSVKKLLYYVTAADQRELADLLGDSPAAVLTKQGNERMLGSVRSSAGVPGRSRYVQRAQVGACIRHGAQLVVPDVHRCADGRAAQPGRVLA
ncbi:type IV secretion system DNA-binding domain-containing protein, partial [Streptomyces cyaneofuscatus]|uniref:type IV secretion system DNA-binding domain-containing protein n=1 Tax=Streptomyces cyaneofuscatus TaxID=66883 RepID=UPI002FF43CED